MNATLELSFIYEDESRALVYHAAILIPDQAPIPFELVILNGKLEHTGKIDSYTPGTMQFPMSLTEKFEDGSAGWLVEFIDPAHMDAPIKRVFGTANGTYDGSYSPDELKD